MELHGIGTIVTGGGRGLGAALAEALSKEGARVVLVARTEGEVRDVEKRIRSSGGEAFALATNVSAPDAAARIAGEAAALVGPVGLLVHAAGSLGPVPLERLLTTSDAAFEEAIGANLLGPFRLTRAVLGSMLLRRRGVVLAVSSDAATEAYPRWGAYGATKAALEQMTRIWAKEVEEAGERDVRLVIVDPGEMDTRMHAEAMPEADPSTLADPRERAAEIVALLRRVESVPTGGSRVALGGAS